MKWKLTCLAASALLSGLLSPEITAATDPNPGDIRLELSPRVCTLASDKENCDTVVTAKWHSPRDESLCLLIVGQPQVRQCWENHTEGEYTVHLIFDRDLLVQLRDAGVVPGAVANLSSAGSYVIVQVDGFGDGLELPTEVASHIYVEA